MPLRSNAIAIQSPDIPAPTTATAGSRLVISATALSGYSASARCLRRCRGGSMFFVFGAPPIGDAGGPARELAEPAGPVVPGAFGDQAAAIGGDDLVLPARNGKD